MRFSWLLVLTLALAAPAASAQTAPYVDPALRALVRRPTQPDAAAAPANAPGIAIRRRTVFDVPRVAVFAKIRSEAAIAELNAAGALIGSRVGDIVTAEIPLDRLAALLASPRFEMFEASHNVTVQNDSSMKAIRANLVRRPAADGTWTGTAGRGVIVGVYDTGIDFLHEDFVDPAGATRVLGIWDQTSTIGSPPAGFSYGTFCSRAAIQSVLNNPASNSACPQQDLSGHGSHVTGTAAGDGSGVRPGDTPFIYAGVAPLADLMIVKGGDGVFSESSIVDGLVWLEQQSRQLNRPMVVNLSAGTQAGPHDGSRLYEAIVDTLSRGGFVVVFSAGNDGVNINDRNPDGTEPARVINYIHGSGVTGIRDFTFEILPYTPEPGKCNDFLSISLWYEGQDRMEVSILRPDGTLVTASALTLREIDSPAGNVYIDNGSLGPNIRNHAYEADIRLNDCGPSGAAPVAGLWTLHVVPVVNVSGIPFHFWMYSQSLGGTSAARPKSGFDNHYVVSSPGNSRSSITVGAFATKMCWTSPAKPEGPVCFVTQEALGDLARFSSGGPTRDGRLKPEVTAPGLGIASTRSRFSSPAANRILADGAHAINQGTSMAAPAVTGAIALMLEKKPTLTAANVRTLLAQTSAHDQFTSKVYDTSADARPEYWWGYGKLDVCASLGALTTTGGGGPGPVAITPAADTLPVNATTRFFSCSPTGASVVFLSSNPAVATVDANGNVRALQVGTTFIIATSGAFADTARVVVTNPASLSVTVRNAAPASSVTAPRGTRIPLLATVLRANGFESIKVTQLSYRVTGIDPAARLVLILDANRNGAIDLVERVIASRAVALTGAPVVVDVPIDSLIVPQRDSVTLIAALELSGGSPNQTVFTVEFIPGSIRSIGTRSGALNRVDAITSPLASSPVTTTVLGEGQAFTLSENPVRSGRVAFNFGSVPRSAGVYTLTGRLVTDLKKRLATNGSVIWDLTNDDGVRVAAGVYLVVFDMSGQLVREKLFVMSGAR